MIIERKTTWLHNKFLPENGWANVQAQLWAYSWMDEWKEAESVTLVGELYLRKGRKNALIRYTDPYFWQKGDPTHEKACSEWFKKYGGEIVD